jgi:hypothetical protein
MMNTYAGYQEQRGCDRGTACPYSGIEVCTASFSAMVIDKYQREKCCGTEDFEDCPIFLSKVLRRA